MHITGALFLALSAGLSLQTGLSSLSAFLPDTQFHIPLTDRQKQILREQGLPEVYEELTAGQRDMLLSIEELMDEVEEKYGKQMLFEEYLPGTKDHPDTVSVQFRDPAWGEEYPNAVVTRTETGGILSFSDNYAVISAALETGEATLADAAMAAGRMTETGLRTGAAS